MNRTKLITKGLRCQARDSNTGGLAKLLSGRQYYSAAAATPEVQPPLIIKQASKVQFR